MPVRLFSAGRGGQRAWRAACAPSASRTSPTWYPARHCVSPVRRSARIASKAHRVRDDPGERRRQPRIESAGLARVRPLRRASGMSQFRRQRAQLTVPPGFAANARPKRTQPPGACIACAGRLSVRPRAPLRRGYSRLPGLRARSAGREAGARATCHLQKDGHQVLRHPLGRHRHARPRHVNRVAARRTARVSDSATATARQAAGSQRRVGAARGRPRTCRWCWSCPSARRLRTCAAGCAAFLPRR